MITLKTWLSDADVTYAQYAERIKEIHRYLHAKIHPYSGWVDWPCRISGGLIKDIADTAEEIRQKCTALVVVGVGGSYLGAKSCIELLQSPFYNEYYAKKTGRPRIYFAGHHVSSTYYAALLKRLAEEDVCLCVISKSGTTLEPSVVFEFLKNYMTERYGEAEAAQRIYAVTDAEKGSLRQEADAWGYKSFTVPSDIGGRYSVLTPVGLLPVAVAGIDIEKIIEGAKQAFQYFDNANICNNSCYKYGLLRHVLQETGKYVEIYEVYEGKFRYFTEWLKQLFGESECKEGKGIIPMSLQMTTDLHSMGQFLQEGRQCFFETVLTVDVVDDDIPLTENAASGLASSMHSLNKVIENSARKAHMLNNTPQICLSVPRLTPESFGYLVYFFEKACAVSCLLMGVDPFNQPGVDKYKSNIKAELATA